MVDKNNNAKTLQAKIIKYTRSKKFSSRCTQQSGVLKPTDTPSNPHPISDVPSILHKSGLKLPIKALKSPAIRQ